MSRSYNKNGLDLEMNCGCMIAIVIFNLMIGGWSVGEILSWFAKDIPAWADVVIGLFVAEISVPIAVVGKILIMFDVF